MKILLTVLVLVASCAPPPATPAPIVSPPSSAKAPTAATSSAFLIHPDRVFDGTAVHEGWGVLVRDDRIVEAGPYDRLAARGDAERAERVELRGATLAPGLIEGHAHVLLHPYDETPWDDQVQKESLGLRSARATVHLRKTLAAGFTTLRDLGTEGAGYADVGLKEAVDKGILVGPRMLVATRAIVATGTYGPRGAPERATEVGAQEADGAEALARAVREQAGHGADWIKVYADYRWGPTGEARPTFTLDELRIAVDVAKSSGRPVVAHASTAEGMRRAALAGVETIEHGDAGTPEVFELLAQRGVVLCPTLAASEAVAQYRGWKKGQGPEPPRVREKRASFRAALAAGVAICSGGDTGVFAHGENARELALLVEYGMPALDALRAATRTNAKMLHMDDRIGAIRAGLYADLAAFDGDPTRDIAALTRVRWVMKAGAVVR